MPQYDNAADLYDSRSSRNSVERYLADHWNPIIANTIKEHCIAKQCLDLGCGTGVFLETAAAVSKAVAGVDISSVMLRYALHKGGFSIVRATVHSLPFIQDSADTIYSIGLMEYVQPHEFLSETHRVLRKGGTFVLLTPNKFGGRKMISHWLHKRHRRKGLARYYSKKEVIEYARRYGFRVKKIVMSDGLIYLPSMVQKIFGCWLYKVTEAVFRPFGQNPCSQNMLFIFTKV